MFFSGRFQLISFNVCWHDAHLLAPLTRGPSICFSSPRNHILTSDCRLYTCLLLPGGGRNCGVHELICARRGKAPPLDLIPALERLSKHELLLLLPPPRARLRLTQSSWPPCFLWLFPEVWCRCSTKFLCRDPRKHNVYGWIMHGISSFSSLQQK